MDAESASIAATPVPSPGDSNHRITRRRQLKHGVDVTVRKGTLGLGPNLAIAGVEISDDGVQVRVNTELKPGEEVEIGLTGVGRSKPTLFIANVRWCQADEADPNRRSYLIGVQFRHRLSFSQFGQFV